ncbi:extracellular solute-binding protein [Lichenicoccus sp.]|uniref:extracellular solute-binding protein n=1 Tax=Lichenicoccus sp. TaxID=2781899 RepID=UPI003D10061E
MIPANSSPCLPALALGLLLGLLVGAAEAQTSKPAHGQEHAESAAAPQNQPPPGASRRPGPHEPSVHAPPLQVATLGGGLQDAQQAALFKPFTDQTGASLHVQGWDGSLSTLQKRATAGEDGWDLVLMEAAPLRVACRQGLFIPDPQQAGAQQTGAQQTGAQQAGAGPPAPDSPGVGCGVAAWRESIVLAWDKSRVDLVPTWADFWDVARRPGKRGLKRDPRGTLEIALMADGVAPDDVYRTLQTPDGINRAFRKLDQLKPYIVWWQTPAEAVQIIESGAVLMTSAPSGEIATADRVGNHRFGTQWAQSLGDVLDWGITRTATPVARAAARQLLAFIQQPDQKQAFSAAYLAQITPATTPATASPGSADAPSGSTHRDDTLMLDEDFWASRLEPLRSRFEAWIGSK